MTAPRPWSTQPITGAQHDAWMAEERQLVSYLSWVLPPCVCGEYDRIHRHGVTVNGQAGVLVDNEELAQ